MELKFRTILKYKIIQAIKQITWTILSLKIIKPIKHKIKVEMIPKIAVKQHKILRAHNKTDQAIKQ